MLYIGYLIIVNGQNIKETQWLRRRSAAVRTHAATRRIYVPPESTASHNCEGVPLPPPV